MTLRARLDVLQRQLDRTDAARAGDLLRAFVDSLTPDQLEALNDALGDATAARLGISDAELDRLLILAFDDDDLRTLWELRGDDLRRVAAESEMTR